MSNIFVYSGVRVRMTPQADGRWTWNVVGDRKMRSRHPMHDKPTAKRSAKRAIDRASA